MDTTIYLAHLWGPVLLAVGLGFFASRDYYVRIYRDLEKDPFAVLFFGMSALAAGIAHVIAHNLWGTPLETLISLIGWALIVKGALCTILPGLADKAGNWMVRSKYVPTIGVVALLLGIYVSWLAYVV